VRIAYDHQIFAQQRYGGISRYFFELASRLPRDEFSEVTVVAPVHVNYYLSIDEARRFARGWYVPYAFRGLTRLVRLANRLAAPLAWSNVNPDILHETYFSSEPIGKARHRVVTVYDMIYELFADEFPDAAQVTAGKRAAVNRADHVICISEKTRQDLVRLFGTDPARTSVVHLGHSMTVEPSGGAEACEGRRPSLLYVGNRAGYKNFSTLLHAYASSPALRELDLIAYGGRPVLPEELKALKDLKLTDRVRFESGSDRDLASRYRHASAFVCPSLYEGFGIPPLEAMSHGCPVVCSNAGSIPEVVGDAGVYFDPTQPEELRAALERVVTTPTLAEDLRARGYARIKRFTWDECAAATARIYRQIG
jgi:glycosyltransferase involved in cell wall biosynthesis